MLFNSFEFIFLFLPVVLLGWHVLGRSGALTSAKGWLLGCSLFFYAWWHPPHLALLLLVLGANYFHCLAIAKQKERRRRQLLALTVTVDLLLLGFYKYSGFVSENLVAMGVHGLSPVALALPLGISFYTFQQIAFAVDVYRGHPAERRPVIYALVVTFFPHLIAGPILHPRKILPQFDALKSGGLRAEHMAPGLALFAMGLFKKTGIADGVASWATPVFDSAAGTAISFLDAWTAALAYTFQIYFDFSGYSDMAIGLGWMFGLRMPVNFNSPYKARSIVDFWRRWHMTLSELLRDYVYIPLGGNRNGPVRRHLNLMATMLIGGLWHGAGWTFILWGGCHGAALILNHLWTQLAGERGAAKVTVWWRREVSWILTFGVLVGTWVIFRSGTLTRAGELLASMTGLKGVSLPPSYAALADHLGMHILFTGGGVQSRWLVFQGVEQLFIFGLLILWVRWMPNTQEVMGLVSEETREIPRRWQWRPNLAWTVFVSLALLVGILRMARSSEFLYFQF